jgi:exosortase A
MSAALAPPMAAGSPWRVAAPAMLLVLAVLLVLYRSSFAGMEAIWSRSDTFAHGYLVAPISAWLIWRRRAVLANMVPRPQPWMLLPIAATAFTWLLGDLAGVNAVTQFAATALLVLAVPAVLGLHVARALLFPLMFLFFMVPVGEFMMPRLMEWTADVTVWFLALVGIPVYREGLQFVIPTGTWSVVEACSGVRYLIASLVVGTLYAYLNYRSMRKRIVFGVVSLLVPVLANWARAIMIVLLGHFSGNKIAAGADHLVYGWVFFGIVIGVMFLIGSRWADAPDDEAPDMPQARAGGRETAVAATASGAAWAGGVALVLLTLAAAPAVAWRLEVRQVDAPLLAMPVLDGNAPQVDASGFRPLFHGAAAEASASYASAAGPVTVHVAYYRKQTYGKKLINSQNMLVKSDDTRWRRAAAGAKRLRVGDAEIELRTAELHEGGLSMGGTGRHLQVRQLYWVDGSYTVSDIRALVGSVFAQLAGRNDDAAALTFTLAGADAATANATLDAFAAQHLAALGAQLRAVRAGR